MSDEAEKYLRYAIERGWLWCGNCGGNKCMDCVLRYCHDVCDDDCPECCEPIGQSHHGATLHSCLRPGWDAA